jgi:hypothetical protein
MISRSDVCQYKKSIEMLSVDLYEKYIICVIFSLLALGLRGASVSDTQDDLQVTRSSL